MSSSKPTRLFVTALLASLIAAAVALAAPARNATLNAASPSYKWTATGSGALAVADLYNAAGCIPGIHDCDDTLLKVDAPGTLTVKTSSSDPAAADADLVLFESTEAGEPGKQLQGSGGTSAAEQVAAGVEPGYYLVRIDYAIAANGEVDGEATLEVDPTAAVGGEQTGGGAATPANKPPAAKVSTPRGKRIRSFSGTATDDGSVAKVAIGLLQLGSGGKCKVLTSAKGTFKAQSKCVEPSKYLSVKGGSKWTFKLSKALKKGRYVLFARATDDKGLSESGYNSANRKAFRVR